MPAASPFLAHSRILCAAHWRAGVIAADANIAADALANFVGAPLIDFVGQERIGYRRAGRADQVQHPAAHQRGHGIGRGETPYTHHRLAGQGLEPGEECLLITLWGKPRGHAVIGPVGNIDIPKIRQLGQHGKHFDAFAVPGQAGAALLLVNGQAHGNGAAVTDGIPGVFYQLAQQAHTIEQRSAIFIRAAIVALRQKVERQAQIMASVYINDVKPCITGTQGRSPVQLAQLLDVGAAHGAGLHRVVAAHGGIGGGPGDFAAGAIGRGIAIEGQFHTRQATVPVNRVTHASQRRYVALVPQACFDIRREFAQGADFALFRADNTPPALGLYCAHTCHSRRMYMPHAITVRYLVKTIARTHGPYLDRLKQNVISRITHRYSPVPK